MNASKLPPITLNVPAGDVDPDIDQLLARGCLIGMHAAFEAMNSLLTQAHREQAFQLLAQLARGERSFADAPDDQPGPAQWPAATRFLALQRDDAARVLRFFAWALGKGPGESR